MGPMDRKMLRLLPNLARTIAETDPELLDMSEENLDGIALVGRNALSSSTSSKLMQSYLSENSIATMQPYEVASLSNLLCGMTLEQWQSFVDEKVFNFILTTALRDLNCRVVPEVDSFLSSLVLAAYGPSSDWSTSKLMSVGWVASCLSPADLASLPFSSLEGLAPNAILHFSNEQLQAISSTRLSHLSPHSASLLSKKQLRALRLDVRIALRGVGGESARVRRDLQEMDGDLNAISHAKTTTHKPKLASTTPAAESQPEITVEPES